MNVQEKDQLITSLLGAHQRLEEELHNECKGSQVEDFKFLKKGLEILQKELETNIPWTGGLGRSCIPD